MFWPSRLSYGGISGRVKHRDRDTSLQPASPGPVTGNGGDAITADALYPRWEDFLRPNDIIITETGTSSMGLAFPKMPKGATFDNQSLWGAISWVAPTPEAARRARHAVRPLTQ